VEDCKPIVEHAKVWAEAVENQAAEQAASEPAPEETASGKEVAEQSEKSPIAG